MKASSVPAKSRLKPVLRHRRARGAVLVIVMWIALGLVSVALLFGGSMMLEYRAADNAVAARQAETAAAGAARYVRFLLSDLTTPGEPLDAADYSAEAVPVGEARFWLVGRDPNEDPDEHPRFGLVDEAGKLNLNTATREMLELLPRMTAELAAAIVDWRDEDDDLSPDGAESETYLKLDPPYNCKNAPFESVDELRLVYGADLEILYGEDTNRNGVLDPNEDDGDASPPSDNADGRLDAGICEYLTVYSRQSNTQADGTPRVNINGGRRQIEEVLVEALGETRTAEIMPLLGPGGQFRSLLEFYYRGQITLDEAALLEDVLTVSDGDEIRGLVNIITAPEPVLLCLPGIGEEGAPAVIAYRQNKTADELATVAWLLAALAPERALEAGPYITVKSYQWTADVAATGRNGRGLARIQWVFDLAGGQPTTLYRRDLSHLGWPLGVDLRATLTAEAREEQR
ncbi:general secretion pathway protein GspK [bacterium]|nr:general secretion pathway protein GspK [bacterium]